MKFTNLALVLWNGACLHLFVRTVSAEPAAQVPEAQVGILGVPMFTNTTAVIGSDEALKRAEGARSRGRGFGQSIYSFYPDCPDTCFENWIGDGWCDTACALEECGNDAGDCEGWCAPDCRSAWIGDGFCDVDCFRAECNFDGVDCDGTLIKGELKFPLSPNDDFDYAKCPTSCPRENLHNSQCDDACNIKECNFDGGDCIHQCSSTCSNQWLGDDHCDLGCNNTACGFDKGDCTICSPGCQPGMVGNGICDPQCNNDDCYMDMGDCFGVCWSAAKVDYFTEPFFYPHCRTEWKGDGSCDCFCFNPHCDNDYGDCENYNCSREFQQLYDVYKRLSLNAAELPLFGSVA